MLERGRAGRILLQVPLEPVGAARPCFVFRRNIGAQ